MARLTRALQHRNYRLFFGGQTVSLVGTWVTRVATSWLVYRLTGSELLLGIVGFAGQIPMLLLAPFAGVLADRWDRHRILVITQALSDGLQSLALAVLALSGRITVTEVILLQVAQGVINAFDTPARQAFVVEMVEDRADLPNAIALNSSMFNASRIIGPTIGGIAHRRGGRGLVLHDRRDLVRRGDPLAAGDALAGAAAASRARTSSTSCARLALRFRIRAGARAAVNGALSARWGCRTRC
jgi:MFS family permease